MTKNIIFILIFQLAVFTGFSQISFSDSTITFKDASGKVLTKDEAQAMTKHPFSTKTEELPNGKKNVTILPVSEKDIADRMKAMEDFKKGLVNSPLQSFEFTDLKGNKLSKADLAGKVIVFNFWFIACKPCVMEMPHLNELVEEYKGKNVVFIAPALDEGPRIEKFLESRSFSYNIVPAARDYAKSLGVRSFPTHLVVDASGIIKTVIIGYNENIKTQVGDAIKQALTTVK